LGVQVEKRRKIRKNRSSPTRRPVRGIFSARIHLVRSKLLCSTSLASKVIHPTSSEDVERRSVKKPSSLMTLSLPSGSSRFLSPQRRTPIHLSGILRCARRDASSGLDARSEHDGISLPFRSPSCSRFNLAVASSFRPSFALDDELKSHEI
jgi:hypothetical protein